MNEALVAATKLAEECEAIRFGWNTLLEEVILDAQQGRLRQFGPDERVVGLTVPEATELLGRLDALQQQLQQVQQPPAAQPQPAAP